MHYFHSSDDEVLYRLPATLTNEPESKPVETLKAGVFLLLVSLIGLGALAPWMGLVGDDWWFFPRISDGIFPATAPGESVVRPLAAPIWAGLWNLFGLRLILYYAVLIFLQWLTSVLVFHVFRDFLRLRMWIATASAAIFLLYPSDSAHVYLSSMSVRVSILLAMAGLTLILHAWRNSIHPIAGIAAGFGMMGLSFLSYETSAYLLLLIPFLLVAVRRRRTALWWTAVPAGYALFAVLVGIRLSAQTIIGDTRPFYASLNIEPEWLISQAKAIPAVTTWKGWLHLISVILEFGVGFSIAAVMILTVLTLLVLVWIERGSRQEPTRPRKSLGLLTLGIAMSILAVAPIGLSTLPLQYTVGTFEGRLIAAAALGHAMLLGGLFSYFDNLTFTPMRALAKALASMLIAIALLGSIGVQLRFVRAWRSQLSIVSGLEQQLPSPPNDLVIVLFQVNAGPFDSRFHYPLTQLVQRFYDNQTLQVLTWQKGYPPDEQLVAFGEEDAIGIVEIVQVEIVQVEVKAFDYELMLAFELGSMEELNRLYEIGQDYLLASGASQSPIPFPVGWEAARRSIKLTNLEQTGINDIQPTSQWQRMFILHLQLFNRLPFELAIEAN